MGSWAPGHGEHLPLRGPGAPAYHQIFSQEPRGRVRQGPPGEGLGVGGECITDEFGNQMGSELPTHPLKSLYTPSSTILVF